MQQAAQFLLCLSLAKAYAAEFGRVYRLRPVEAMSGPPPRRSRCRGNDRYSGTTGGSYGVT